MYRAGDRPATDQRCICGQMQDKAWRNDIRKTETSGRSGLCGESKTEPGFHCRQHLGRLAPLTNRYCAP
jgi:hypothetical protein